MSLEERETLYCLWKYEKFSLRAIAKQMGRTHTTLLRELRRNTRFTSPYQPSHAHNYATRRNQLYRATAALKQPEIYDYVLEKLQLKWSPETIAGRLKLDHPGLSIHHETIYRYIYRESMRGWYLWMYLTHARKRRMQRYGRRVKQGALIADRTFIDLRPEVVAKRGTVGHWETDNVIGKQTDMTALSTTVERKTRYTVLTKLRNKSAEIKRDALIWRLLSFPQHLRQTMTTDNGSENKLHLEVTATLHMPIYFCHAYHSWEKGTVENMNGRIRRYIPKGKSLDGLTEEEIARVEYELNSTPRKCLGYRTPEEMMQQAIDMSG